MSDQLLSLLPQPRERPQGWAPVLHHSEFPKPRGTSCSPVRQWYFFIASSKEGSGTNPAAAGTPTNQDIPMFLAGVSFTQTTHLSRSSSVMLAAASRPGYPLFLAKSLLRSVFHSRPASLSVLNSPTLMLLLTVITYESIASNKAVCKRQLSYIYSEAVINQANNLGKRENQVSFTRLFPCKSCWPLLFPLAFFTADFYTIISLLCPEWLAGWLRITYIALVIFLMIYPKCSIPPVL